MHTGYLHKRATRNLSQPGGGGGGVGGGKGSVCVLWEALWREGGVVGGVGVWVCVWSGVVVVVVRRGGGVWGVWVCGCVGGSRGALLSLSYPPGLAQKQNCGQFYCGQVQEL